MLLTTLALAMTVAQGPAEWYEPFPAHKVIGNVYYVGSKDLATYLIATPDGHILINSGFDRTVPLIQASVESLGFKMTDVKILLASHAHSDHVAGHALLQKVTGAKVFVMKGDDDVIASGGKGQYMYKTDRWAPCKVDRVLKDRDEVKLGGSTLVARLTPGHTRGCTTWTWRVEDAGKKYDVVVIGSPNLNPGFQLVNNKDYPEMAADFAKTFEVLKSLPCDIFLGAHGSYYGMVERYPLIKKGQADAFVNPEGYKEYVALKERAYRKTLATQQGKAEQAPADLVIRNGKIFTVDAKSFMAEAVAIRDGVFVLVGSNAEIQKLVGDKTRVIDAQGRTVVPGLIESHVHAVGAARGEALLPFVQLTSIGEIQDWVRKQAKGQTEGKWIQAPRVDITRIRERRLPTRADLDAAAPQHPVVFTWQYAAHVVQVLNSAALQAARITRDTPEPKGGKIFKDDKGELTGVMENVGDLVNKHIPPRHVPEDDHLKALESLVQRYHEVGITSIFERNSTVEGYRAYEKLKAKGRLTIRVVVTIGQRSDGTLDGMEKWLKGLPFKFGDGDEWLQVGPIKFFVDGGVLYGTAYLLEPWGRQPLFGITDPKYRGTLTLSKDKIENVIRAGHKHGWQMCSHVTGDAGVNVVLDALEAVHKDNPIDQRRYTLIHAYFPNPKAVRRAAALGVCVDTQPAWYAKDTDALSTALGESRLQNFIGLNDWRRGGVKVALNSDHMQGADPNTSLNPYNPFLTMYTAVTRKTDSGLVVGPEHKVSRADALRMMTLDAAYLSFDEKRKGSIEPGKLADLAILSDHLLTCDAERIKDIRAVVTVVGGRVVHETKMQAGK